MARSFNQVTLMGNLTRDPELRYTPNGAAVVKLGVDLPGVTLLPGEDPGTQNPHLWMDVKYAERYADLMRRVGLPE